MEFIYTAWAIEFFNMGLRHDICYGYVILNIEQKVISKWYLGMTIYNNALYLRTERDMYSCLNHGVSRFDK